jgi:hypothetical protein
LICLPYLGLRDKGKNLRRCTKTVVVAVVVVRQVLQMLEEAEGQPFRSAPYCCGRRSFDRDTKRWLSFASKNQEDLCAAAVVVVAFAAAVVVVEPLSSPSDRPASPSNCDFWQRVDPFDSGYYHCWEPKEKEEKSK